MPRFLTASLALLIALAFVVPSSNGAEPPTSTTGDKIAAATSTPSSASSDKAGPRKRLKPMSRDAAKKYCAARAVDIEIIGTDAQGKYIVHGAGSVLHEDGYILTCEHITAPGFHKKVFFADGSSLDFEYVARGGGSYDTAILRVKPGDKQLTPIVLGHSKQVKKGTKVLTVGNPGGRRHTVNFGKVQHTDSGGGTQFHVIEANVLPGDSGGPVFNMRGEQIAHVHVKIFTLEKASRHIQVDHLRKAFQETFMDEGRYEFGLGIEVDCQGDKALVTKVKKGSAGAKGGIAKGDVITKFDDMRIGNGVHYVLAMMDRVRKPPVTLTILRDGAEQQIELTPHRVSRK